MSERWDRHFLAKALECASMSKDPDKQVGAVIVRDGIQVSDGFNGFPRGIKDTPKRLSDKPLKRRLTVHGERNALLNAARLGTPVLGTTLYFACMDEWGPHGGCPCTDCTIELIQAGIVEVVSFPPKLNSSWLENIQFAQLLLSEASVTYREIKP